MSLLRSLFLAYSLIAVSGCSVSSKQLNLVGNPAPNAIYYPLKSESRALSSESGKIVVLAFWDSGCYHCQRELPIIEQLASKYIDNERIKFIAVSLNAASEENLLKSAIHKLGLRHLEHCFSGNEFDDSAFTAFRGNAIPYFVVVDQDGIVRWVGHDASEVSERLKDILRHGSK